VVSNLKNEEYFHLRVLASFLILYIVSLATFAMFTSNYSSSNSLHKPPKATSLNFFPNLILLNQKKLIICEVYLFNSQFMSFDLFGLSKKGTWYKAMRTLPFERESDLLVPSHNK
jgi:hypothetical protein